MGLLSSLAKASARASGRALAAHVLPDSLVPSWKTQKAISSGYSLLKKAAKTKKGTANGKGAARSAQRPGPKPPKKKFDKQSWAVGRGLPSGDGFAVQRQSSPKSSFLSSAKTQAAKLRRKSIDLARNPRVAAQMGLDLLKEDYQTKKRSFLSELDYVKSLTRRKK